MLGPISPRLDTRLTQGATRRFLPHSFVGRQNDEPVQRGGREDCLPTAGAYKGHGGGRQRAMASNYAPIGAGLGVRFPTSVPNSSLAESLSFGPPRQRANWLEGVKCVRPAFSRALLCIAPWAEFLIGESARDRMSVRPS